MNNISKTIKESEKIFDGEFGWLFEKPLMFNTPLGTQFLNVEMTKTELKSHLLQSQIRLIDSWIDELKKEHDQRNDFTNKYNQGMEAGRLYFIEDQISSLNETLEELKKSL